MDGATSPEKGGIWIEKYRPRSLSEIVGQEAITSRLKGYVEKKDLPHLLFSGPAGVGKTTSSVAIAQEMYGASEVVADTKIRDQLKKMQDDGFGKLPICIAKTQYSFSTDPNLKGAPEGHVLPIREIKLSSGAEFIVVICGSIMTMPGLPRVPAAQSIKLNEKGEIEGLF